MKLTYTAGVRSYSSSIFQVLPSKIIRNRFLEYFINEHQHGYVKSIPVASHFEHSVDLIHSEMYQFIRVFTGEEHFDQNKVAGLQKCLKLRKRLSDLEKFNRNPHKLSFFEMMGNWSFDVDNKKESCKLAWNLLTSSPFAISPGKLLVSYFSGDENLSLPIDEEVREIWLELGVPKNQIFPYNSKNFWELSAAGPCGTSTKIYVALPESRGMLELWNIRFAKYRRVDNVLKLLPQESVSAGLGLERLVSVLQRTYSCYHTDSFEPLFDTVQKISGAPEYKKIFVSDSDINTKYRQLTDFTRAITVAVADNVFPDTNIKIKRILRKALYIARTDFKQEQPHRMLMELSARVAETLQETYPEVGENLCKVQLIMENEENIIQDAIASKQTWWTIAKPQYPFSRSASFVEYPETVEAFPFQRIIEIIDRTSSDVLPAREISEVCDKFSIPRTVLEEILAYFGRSVNWNERQDEMSSRPRKPTREPAPIEKCLMEIGISSDDSLKHNYYRNEDGADNPYNFPKAKARLLAIVNDREILSVDEKCDPLPNNLKEISGAEVSVYDQELGFIFDRTNFTTQGGNRYYDKGYIAIDQKYTFKVNSVKKIQNLVIHYAEPLYKVENGTLKAGFEATLSIDAERRLKLMRNNTLSYLLSMALKEIFPVVYLKYMKSNDEYCQLKTSVLGKEVDVDECGKLLEFKIQDYIDKKLEIRTKCFQTSLQLLQQPNVLYQPNLIYPYKNIRLIAILDKFEDVIWQEPCDCVHVFNTGDIGQVVIPHLNYIKYKRLHVFGILEHTAVHALNLQNWIQSQTLALQDEANKMINESLSFDQLVNLGEKLYLLAYKIARDTFFTPHLITRSTYTDYRKIRDIKLKLASEFSTAPSEILVEILRSKIKELAAKDKFVIYFCMLPIPFFQQLSFIIDILYKNEFPTLFLCYYRSWVKGVCHVPQHCVSEHFNAENWIKSTLHGFDNNLKIKEEVENEVFCYLKGEVVKYYEVMNYVEALTVLGKMTAEEHFARDLGKTDKS